MKYIYKYLCIIIASLTLGACNYLDIVPDETPSEEDAFKNPRAAEEFLYACYSKIPINCSSGGLDAFTGDEVITPFEHEAFANFPKGNYTATNPQLSYWNTIFTAIRYCYMLKNNIDKVPNMDPKIATDYKAQADFLIGFYTFTLVRSYGPSILINGVEDINQKVETFKGRSSYDESVKFIVQKMDESAMVLPPVRTGDELGLATSVMAKAIKAKTLLYAASPLFNGNSKFYNDFKDPNGKPLMPTTYDPQKWVLAKKAAKECIDICMANGLQLYKEVPNSHLDITEPQNEVERTLRLTVIDKSNMSETIWPETRGFSYYDLQSKSAPYSSKGACWNGVSPTLAMVERFYTVNGLPIDEDPSFDYTNRYQMDQFAPKDIHGEGDTWKLNLNREPRFYSWITFNNGYYEISGEQKDIKPETSQYNPKWKRGDRGGKVIMKMLIGQPGGRGLSANTARNNNYSPTGYLNKKGVHPLKTPNDYFIQYIWPSIRLSDIYLCYAEACIESGDLNEGKAYIDKIRERAGIPSIDQAWAKAKHPNKANTQEGLRDIVRQERMIELYLENQNFWDMRRWLLAEKYFNTQPYGMNIMADNDNEWNKVTAVPVERKFSSPRNYLMPIPQGEINKNKNLQQNPGY